MSNRRDTFAKRQRETELKERARMKRERRIAKRNEPRAGKGPPIAWDEAVGVAGAAGDGAAPPAATPPVTPAVASDDAPAEPTE